MGFGGISPWSLLIILVIVLLLFGTKRLRNIGGDLGDAIKNFKQSMGKKEESDVDKKIDDKKTVAKDSNVKGRVIDVEVEKKQKV